MLIATQYVGLAAGGVPAITSLLSVSETESTSDTIAWPAVQNGDIAVLFDWAASAVSTPTAVTPTGFTNMCNAAISTERAMSSFKRCDGTETGNITGMNGNVLDRKLLVILRPDIPIATANGGGGQNGALVSTDPPDIVVPASAAVAPVIVFGMYRSSGAVDPRTFTPAKDDEASADAGAKWIAWKLFLTDPEDVTIGMADEGNDNIVQGFYIELAA